MFPNFMSGKYSALKKDKSTCVYIREKDGLLIPEEDAFEVLKREISYDTKIKHYKGGLKKVTYCNNKIFKLSGYKRINLDDFLVGEIERVKEHKRKRLDNLRRAKERVYDFILLNDFEWFLTITMDKDKIARDNVSEVIKKLSKWLNNQVVRKGLKYVLIPEYHKKDNGIHCHALISGNLNFVDSGTRVVKGYSKPLRVTTIRQKRIPESDVLHTVYNVTDWKYGYSTAIKCYGDVLRRANYIVKYITKDLNKIFGNYYWHSRNLISEPEIELMNTGWGYLGLELPEYGHYQSDNRFKYETNIGFIKGGKENDSKRIDE